MTMPHTKLCSPVIQQQVGQGHCSRTNQLTYFSLCLKVTYRASKAYFAAQLSPVQQLPKQEIEDRRATEVAQESHSSWSPSMLTKDRKRL